MCGRILLWALALGFAGGFGGVMLATEIWPDDFKAPAIALVAGATLGAGIGAGSVVAFGRRGPGD